MLRTGNQLSRTKTSIEGSPPLTKGGQGVLAFRIMRPERRYISLIVGGGGIRII